MEPLEIMLSTRDIIVKKYQSFAFKPDYKKIFFGHLGPELTKVFMEKKDKVFLKNFLEASQYEYGFFGQKIDLPKALSLYKKYADLNDYFCMYKMHVIYLCEYQKFNVPLNRILEKMYLFKCFAYLPNYIMDWKMNLFETINIVDEIGRVIYLEGGNLDVYNTYFDILYKQKDKYNISENDINLMKSVLLFYFSDEQGLTETIFSTLNSLIPKNELDYAYYYAKNKYMYFSTSFDLDFQIDESDIHKFYEEVKSKKLFELYADYGNYLLNKRIRADPEIIEIFSSAAKNGYLFNSFRAYQCLVDYYDFEEIMTDYNKAEKILDFLLEEIVFENIANKPFILLVGYLIKYSKFPEKIISKYLVYVKEIYQRVNSTLINKEKGILLEEDEYLLVIKGYIYYFGFEGTEKENIFDAFHYLDKASHIIKKIRTKKKNEFMKYKLMQIMNSINFISEEVLMKEKKNIHNLFWSDFNLSNEINDCYIIGENYFEGITEKKDEDLTFLLFNSALKDIFCKDISECKTKSDIKKFLNNHDLKTEIKLKEAICCICYVKKVSKVFIPCKHVFCSNCADILKKELKCPFCRGEIFCVV